MADLSNIQPNPVNQHFPAQCNTKGILKQSTPTTQNNSDANERTMNSDMVIDGINSNGSSQNNSDATESSNSTPKWKRPKVPGTKVNRKLKRLRLNQRLKRSVMPKNAIMVLNEMKAGVKLNLLENQSIPNSLFLVQAELDGKVYVGQGLSKPLARQNAAENALKSLLLEKMAASAMKVKPEEETSNEDLSCSSIDMSSVDENDEVPWSLVASFALYKLFLDWQNQGTVVPFSKMGTNLLPSKSKAEPPLPAEKKLPSNPSSIHPVTLLNQMKPGTTFIEVSRVGNPPNIIFTLSVEIDGTVYSGEAKNKKDAKKNAAKAALLNLYGLEYPKEETNDVEMK